MRETQNMTIQHYAKHIPGEHPTYGFATKEEARAFIKGYALCCGHEGKRKECEGALAEWEIVGD